jgi:hypothetical protein
VKKVLILLIVGAAACVAAFFALRDAFDKAQLRTRISELGGLASTSGGSTQLSLERDWWHKDLPSKTDDFPEAEYNANPPPYGRNDWYGEWQRENTELGGQGMLRMAADADIEFLERIAEGPYAGGWRVKWTWHQGVPNSGYGERATYEATWHYDDLFWRIVRLKLVGDKVRTDHGPTPKK